jgi:hypothetical protein
MKFENVPITSPLLNNHKKELRKLTHKIHLAYNHQDSKMYGGTVKGKVILVAGREGP